MLLFAMEPRRRRLVIPLRLQPRFNSGGSLGAVKLLPNVPGPPISLASLGRIAASTGGHQVGSQRAAAVRARLDVIEGQTDEMPRVVAALTAVSTATPLALDGFSEASSGGIG